MTNTAFDWVGPDFRPLVTTQAYGPAPRIDGVQIHERPVFSDEGGDFCEVVRLAGDEVQGLEGFSPRQMNYSLMEPGAIKAWHVHSRQDDLWFVPTEHRVLIGLLDVRPESPTYRTSMRLTCGTGKAYLLYIPRGVAHGVANVSSARATIMYLVNQLFEPTAPDEHRLPFDLLGAGFWSVQPG